MAGGRVAHVPRVVYAKFKNGELIAKLKKQNSDMNKRIKEVRAMELKPSKSKNLRRSKMNAV